MHKAGGREAAAIRIVPVGRVELSTDIRRARKSDGGRWEVGKEREREREKTSRENRECEGGWQSERGNSARRSITCGSN